MLGLTPTLICVCLFGVCSIIYVNTGSQKHRCIRHYTLIVPMRSSRTNCFSTAITGRAAIPDSRAHCTKFSSTSPQVRAPDVTPAPLKNRLMANSVSVSHTCVRKSGSVCCVYLMVAIRSCAPLHVKNGLADPRTSVVAPPPRDTPTFFSTRRTAAFSIGE